MWSQQYTQSQLRFPHEALEPALLDEKAVEKKNVKKKDVKKKVSEAKKDDKAVAEVEAKAIVVAVGEDSKTSKESDSTAAVSHPLMSPLKSEYCQRARMEDYLVLHNGDSSPSGN